MFWKQFIMFWEIERIPIYLKSFVLKYLYLFGNISECSENNLDLFWKTSQSVQKNCLHEKFPINIVKHFGKF